MPPSTINGFTVAYATAGGIILWSGVKGWTLTETFHSLLSGKTPTQNKEPIGTLSLTQTGSGSGSGSGSGTTDSGIANDALQYTGSRYVWGGTPGTSKGHDNGTDCSGFINMVIGRDLGKAIPGYPAGGYNGSSHGPTSQEWLLWGGCKNIPAGQVQAGDLACWVTHIGIYTDNGQHIVSALDTQSGVIVTTVNGGSPTGEPLISRRYQG